MNICTIIIIPDLFRPRLGACLAIIKEEYICYPTLSGASGKYGPLPHETPRLVGAPGGLLASGAETFPDLPDAPLSLRRKLVYIMINLSVMAVKRAGDVSL